MRQVCRSLTALAVLIMLACAPKVETVPSTPGGVREALAKRWAGMGEGEISAGGIRLRGSAAIRPVYVDRQFAPVWVDVSGVAPEGETLVAALRQAGDEGLSPRDYNLAEIEKLQHALADEKGRRGDAAVGTLADLELLLSGSFLAYAVDLSDGRIDPRKVMANWEIRREASNPAGLLRAAAGAPDIDAFLRSLPPPHFVYGELKRELARYRALAESGGWPAVSGARKLRKGDKGTDVAALRARLAAEGYFENPDTGDDKRFDSALESALKEYQRRNGLDADGVAGRETYAALNISADARARQIAANMERLRWLPRSLGERYLVVDIAGFRLVVFEKDLALLSMRAIVGKDDRQTPVFRATMNHVVFNPYWRVPHSIAIKDELPRIRKEPDFFEKLQMELFRYARGGGTHRIDPATVDWTRVTEDNFGYFLRQKPGAKNALGRVKFMFPNGYNIYIHDTPAKNLFLSSKRTFSSGCVRVEKPVDLGEYVLAGNPGWDRERFLKTIETKKTQTIHLQRPLPVYLVYFTAWAERGETVEFRGDVYGRDAALTKALAEQGPVVVKTIRKTSRALPGTEGP